MLKVFVDDSSVGDEPISILAGWAAEDVVWDSFEKEWKAALGMTPRLAYFKETEANGRSGEFSGWSDEPFAQRMHLLSRIMAEHRLFGVASAIPTKLYKDVFGENEDAFLRHPYFFLFNDLVTVMSIFLGQQGFTGKVQFIFDEQKGQEEAVSDSWPRLLQAAPPNVKPLLTEYPLFRSDKTTLPLQAADYSAGFLRRRLVDSLNGVDEPDPPWVEKMREMYCIGKLWDLRQLRELSERTPRFAPAMRIPEA